MSGARSDLLEQPTVSTEWYARVGPAHYAKVAEKYFHGQMPEAVPQQLSEPALLEQLVRMAPNNGRRGLDVGCGPSGRHMSYLDDVVGRKVFGVDVQPENIAFLRVHRPELKSRVAVHDIATSPVLPRSFPGKYDFVTCMYVLQHMEPETIPTTLQRLASLLEDGGVLQLAFKAGQGVYVCQDPDHDLQRSFHLYEPDHILKLASSAGLELVRAPEGGGLGGVMGFQATSGPRETIVWLRKGDPKPDQPTAHDPVPACAALVDGFSKSDKPDPVVSAHPSHLHWAIPAHCDFSSRNQPLTPARLRAELGQKDREKAPATHAQLLDGIDQESLPPRIRTFLRAMQKNLVAAHKTATSVHYTGARTPIKRPHRRKYDLDGKLGMSNAGEFLRKPFSSREPPSVSDRLLENDPDFSRIKATQVEFLTTLANLLGCPTSLAVAHQLDIPGCPEDSGWGVTVQKVPGVVPAKQYHVHRDEHGLRRATASVKSSLLVGRAFNQVIHNLDCVFHQFLVPAPRKGETENHDFIIQVDFDEAFCSFPPEELQPALKSFFIDAELDECGFLSKPFDFNEPIGWTKDHWDGRMNIYGPLFAEYINGDIELDFDRVNLEMQRWSQIPDQVLRNCMRPFLDVCEEELGQPIVVLEGSPSAEIPRRAFEDALINRIKRAPAEYDSFLTDLHKARSARAKGLSHPISDFYAQLPVWNFGLKAGGHEQRQRVTHES
ncbi:class I SAM-dependent methyltransferase [Myxococcota bacterium]